MTFEELYEYLIQERYFTPSELALVTDINGNTIETLNDCIYARYGYRDIEQLREE